MNTTPDETLLALWLDDELVGPDLARVEAWALTQPDQLAAREEIRAFRTMMAGALPAAEEPPYPDFFNSRIAQAIRAEAPRPQPAAATPRVPFWRSWIFPATAFAGMALAFWVGTKTQEGGAAAPIAKIQDTAPSPIYYTPEQGMNAEWVKGDGRPTVIVLQGLNDLPDTVDFSQAVSYQTSPGPGSSTASAGTEVKSGR